MKYYTLRYNFVSAFVTDMVPPEVINKGLFRAVLPTEVTSMRIIFLVADEGIENNVIKKPEYLRGIRAGGLAHQFETGGEIRTSFALIRVCERDSHGLAEILLVQSLNQAIGQTVTIVTFRRVSLSSNGSARRGRDWESGCACDASSHEES